MLIDRAYDELSESTCSRSAVAAPSCSLDHDEACFVEQGGPERVRGQGECVGHSAHDELVRKIISSVYILKYQSELPHQERVLEIIRQSRHKLGDKERIVGG